MRWNGVTESSGTKWTRQRCGKLYDEFSTLADKKREILDEEPAGAVARPVPRRAGSIPARVSPGHLRHGLRDGGRAAGGSLERNGTGCDGDRNGPIAATFAAIAKVVERQWKS